MLPIFLCSYMRSSCSLSINQHSIILQRPFFRKHPTSEHNDPRLMARQRQTARATISDTKPARSNMPAAENDNCGEAGQVVESPENSTLDSNVTRLYKHVCHYNSCPARWSKFPANEEEQVHLAKNITQDPIVHRHEYVDKAWVTKSFTIQDKAMQKLLNKALANYHDLDMALEEWTFKPPYRALVHRWDVLKDLQAVAEGEEKAAADPLVEFLTPILAPSVESLFQTKLTGKVSFENVWQIFQPGEHVMTKFYGTEVVCRVLKYERIQTNCALYWQITFEYVDWNGQSCGYATTSTKIGYFGGFRRVTALPVYPLSFEDDAPQIKDRIIARGRKFEELRGYHFMTCDGKKVLLEQPEERPVIFSFSPSLIHVC